MTLKLFKNNFDIKKLIIISFVTILGISGSAFAAATITVTPSTGLVNGQKVTVTANGLKSSSVGSIEECSDVPTPTPQPTVSIYGNATPVSCTAPVVLSTSATGTISSTFTIIEGITGPPATGTDSNNVSATTDAGLFPCPPTAAQIAAGYSCQIVYGDIGGDSPSQNIAFASQASTATTSTTSTTSTTTTTPTTTATKLVNTGPGNVIGLFIVIAAISGIARFAFLSLNKKSV